MAITINSNIPSITAQRNLGQATKALSESFARLSSGLRINKASDDAAGLSIADKLRADKRIAAVAIRNANDGISALNIADGAMNEISGLLARMGELAEQSGNGILGTAQRTALSKEFESLALEIDRIVDVTEFNNTRLLTGGSISLQVGLRGTTIGAVPTGGTSTALTDGHTGGTGSHNQIVLDMASMSLSGLGLSSIADFTADGKPAGTSLNTESDARTALDAVRAAIDTVSEKRGDLGAVQSRLATTVSNLEVTRENYAAAESQIRDVDVASEASEMTRLSILQQAGASVLSQANQMPGLALKLLG